MPDTTATRLIKRLYAKLGQLQVSFSHELATYYIRRNLLLVQCIIGPF